MRKKTLLILAAAAFFAAVFCVSAPSVTAASTICNIAGGSVTIENGSTPDKIKVTQIGGVSAEFSVSDNIIIEGNSTANTVMVKTDDSRVVKITLSGVNINLGSSSANPFHMAENSKVALTLSGDNNLKCYDEGNAGLYAFIGSELTIDGSGTLTATGRDGKNESRGIYIEGKLNILGGRVVGIGGRSTGGSYGVQVGTNGSLNVSGGELSGTGGETGGSLGSYGVYVMTNNSTGPAVTVTVSGGSVTGTSGVVPNTGSRYGVFFYRNVSVSGTGSVYGTVGSTDATNPDNSCGVCVGSFDMSSSYKLNVEGGSVTGTGGNANKLSCGVSAGVLSISGGTVTGTAGNTSEDTGHSYGVRTRSRTDGITLTGTGVLKGTGGDALGKDGCSYGVSTGGLLSVSGGSLEGNGNTAAAAGGNSYGVYAGGFVAGDAVNVSGGSLTGTAGEGDSSFGVIAFAKINVSNGSLTGTAGRAREVDSRGVYTNKDLLVSGGSLTGTGGTGAGSGGSIGVDCFGITTITGGTTIATGNTSATNHQPVFYDTTQADPNWYKWKQGTSASAPAGDYISSSDTSQYSYDSEHKYLEFRSRLEPLTGVTLSTNTPAIGIPITATPIPAGATVTYQWYEDGRPIGGATGASYTPKISDYNKALKVVITGAGSYIGTAENTTTSMVKPSAVITPSSSFTKGAAPANERFIIGEGIYSADLGAANFVSLTMDGVEVDEGPNTFTTENGSLIINFAQSYLNGLAEGSHRLAVTIDGTYSGTYATTLTVRPVPAPSPGRANPGTGV